MVRGVSMGEIDSNSFFEQTHKHDYSEKAMAEASYASKVIGLRVSTRPDGPRDFTSTAQRTRHRGVGIIVGFHNSHGLCFDVQHEHGVISTYDPDEIVLMGP